MRTAEEIYSSIIKNNRKGMPPMEIAIKCIRVAREDVVLEAAKVFEKKVHSYYGKDKIAKLKQSILNLINELK